MPFKDCIYRFIEVPDICLQIIDTPYFQRLRDIKQLGLTSYVFPSANHTRFEHSIGVMYLAGEFIEKLLENSPEIIITPREKLLVQVAGLLHDVGHIAFSHFMDHIMNEKRGYELHEKRSIYLLKLINDHLYIQNDKLLFTQEEIEMIGDMILGNTENKNKPFLYEIINNKRHGLDVDRFDYLQRDSYHTGIPGFQPDYLMRNMYISLDDLHITYREKAKNEVKRMLDTREYMYDAVYCNSTTISLENHIKKMLTDELLDKIDDWKDLVDYELIKLLKTNNPCEWNKVLKRNWDKMS